MLYSSRSSVSIFNNSRFRLFWGHKGKSTIILPVEILEKKIFLSSQIKIYIFSGSLRLLVEICKLREKIVSFKNFLNNSEKYR